VCPVQTASSLRARIQGIEWMVRCSDAKTAIATSLRSNVPLADDVPDTQHRHCAPEYKELNGWYVVLMQRPP
jgi:hypothetical protein